MSSKSSDLIVLLGAGASAEAGIPTSAEMIERIELLLFESNEWRGFARLYFHVRSSIFYSAGLRGQFNNNVTYNIETLVNTLHELERNEDHPLYPFIASWNSRFLVLAGIDFAEVGKFRELILKQLKKWMCPEEPDKWKYYQGLRKIQQHFNYPLSIFTLNYDLLVESLFTERFRIESGFSGFGSDHLWELERFSENEGSLPEVLLYKLHGSISWKRNQETQGLYQVNQVEAVSPTEMEVIFGREFKLEAGDPYLFYAYEFRRMTSEARLILCLGYGFADPHINKLLSQALRLQNGPVLAVVGPQSETFREQAAKALGVGDEGRIEFIESTAKEYLSNADIGSAVQTLMPPLSDPFEDSGAGSAGPEHLTRFTESIASLNELDCPAVKYWTIFRTVLPNNRSVRSQ